MKVRTKLTIGFLVVVLLIWVTVFFAANTYMKIHEEFEVLKGAITGTIAMSELAEKVEEIRAWALVYSLRGNVVIMDKPIKEWLQETTTSLEELARENREHETHIGLEEQKDAEELEDRVKQLNSAVVELINLKDQGTEIDELKEKMKEFFALNFPPLVEQLEKHRAAHMEELAAAEEAVHESETSGRQVLLLAAGLITLLAVAAAWFTARSIVKPLHALHRGTEIIGQGNLDYKVGTKAKDEIGQLSRAFDQMTEDLGGTTTSIDKLNKEITERKRAEHNLKERVKELECLYRISKIDENPDITLDELYEEVAKVLPASWQYPEITCSRVTIDGKEFETENCRETEWKLSSDIRVRGAKAGEVEVSYLEERPELDEGPFSKEEHLLIDAVAQRLGRITERKRAEEEIDSQRKKLEDIMESMVDGVTICNMNGQIISINQAATEQQGYNKEEAIGKTPAEIFIAEEDIPKFVEVVKRLASGEIVKEQEYTAKHKDGRTFTVSVNLSLLKDAKGKPVAIIAVHRDVTERKHAEEEREALLKDLEIINRRLEESNRELQDFVYVASHDLREPLRKITSFGLLLQGSLGGKLDEDQQENFEFMIDGSKRMQMMIDDLLTYSRVTTKAKPLQQVNLNSVIEDLKNLELATLLDETKATIHVPETLPPVHGDSSQIHQLLQNLVGNGLKFHREGVPPEITIRAHRIENNMVRVEVQDNGIGINEEYHEQVFTMFKRLHSREQYEGTGIGLAVCKKIVNRHGGDIGVKSTPSEGSTFWFTLPRGSY